MVDPIAATGLAISGYQALKNTVTSVSKLAKDKKDVQLQAFVLDMQDQLFQLREKLDGLVTENENLKEAFKIKAKLTFDGIVYRDEEKLPYCPKCWDADSVVVHVVRQNYTQTPSCPNCKNHYAIND